MKAGKYLLSLLGYQRNGKRAAHEFLQILTSGMNEATRKSELIV